VDHLVDSCEDALTDQDLTRRGAGAESGGEVRHRAERSVVIPTFEANPTKRRMTCLDSLPYPRQFPESLLGSERKSDRLEIMVLDG